MLSDRKVHPQTFCTLVVPFTGNEKALKVARTESKEHSIVIIHNNKNHLLFHLGVAIKLIQLRNNKDNNVTIDSALYKIALNSETT